MKIFAVARWIVAVLCLPGVMYAVAGAWVLDIIDDVERKFT